MRFLSVYTRREIAIIMLPVFTVMAQIGCATMSNRTKTLILAGAVAAVGAGAGYKLAPHNERPEMHAAFGAAIGGVTGALAGLFIFDERKRSSEFEHQAQTMKKELDALRDESVSSGASHEPKLLYETTAPVGREIPSEYSGLVSPGRWSVYKLNQWVTQGDEVIVHQDRMVKLIPPQLTPRSQNLSGESQDLPNSARTKDGSVAK